MIVKQVLILFSVITLAVSANIGHSEESDDQELLKDLYNNEYRAAPITIIYPDKAATENTDKEKPLQLETIVIQFGAIFTKLEELDRTLNQKIDKLTAKINDNVNKQLTDFEQIYSERLDTLEKIITSKNLEVTAESDTQSTTDSDVNPTESSNRPSESDDIQAVNDTDAVVEVSGSDQWDESNWCSVFYEDPAEDALTLDRNWGPGDDPDPDQYDIRLKSKTGCKSRLVPPYDRQPFHWYYSRWSPSRLNDSDGERVETYTSPIEVDQRLAVRTVGDGRADIKIYWNGVKKYYFAFSNSSNTVEFFRYSPWKLLWKAELPSPAAGEHYTPIHFTLTRDHLTFTAGCGRTGHAARIPTAQGDEVQLEVETSAFPAKMLYDCSAH